MSSENRTQEWILSQVAELIRCGGPEDGCEDDDVSAIWPVLKRFAFGQCDSFANALHEVSGRPIGAVLLREPGKVEFSTRADFRHAFVILDSTAPDFFDWTVADVGGIKTVTQMMEPYWYADTEEGDIRIDVFDGPDHFSAAIGSVRNAKYEDDAKRLIEQCFYLNDLTDLAAPVDAFVAACRPVYTCGPGLS